MRVAVSDKRVLRALKLPKAFPHNGSRLGISSKLSRGAMLLSPSAGSGLAKRVEKLLKTRSADLKVERFPNSESRVEIRESVRDKHAFLIGGDKESINESLIDTALVAQALSLSDARRITAVLPYFPYARQDRRAESDQRPPISAKMVTALLKQMGVHNIISVDLHATQVEGFFDGPFDNLSGLNQIVPWLIKEEGNQLTIVSPDAGGSKRAEQFARNVEKISGEFSPLLVMSKFRKRPNVPPVVTLSADPEVLAGRTCVLVDDMIDTGGSIIAAARKLKEAGAARVVVCASHGIFSSNAIEKLRSAQVTCGVDKRQVSAVDAIFVTDSIEQKVTAPGFLKVVSIAPLIAAAIKRLDTPLGTLRDLKSCCNLGAPLWKQEDKKVQDMNSVSVDSLSSRLAKAMGTYEDFPKVGIRFRDISPILADPALLAETIDAMARVVKDSGASYVAGLESRGFLFGVSIAQRLGIPFVPIRKPGKLPGKVYNVAYKLEYGEGHLQMQKGVIPSGAKVAVVDDLLATGGTALGASKLIEMAGAVVSIVSSVVELKALNGKATLGAIKSHALVVE